MKAINFKFNNGNNRTVPYDCVLVSNYLVINEVIYWAFTYSFLKTIAKTENDIGIWRLKEWKNKNKLKLTK
jgi:hypothetical protein